MWVNGGVLTTGGVPHDPPFGVGFPCGYDTVACFRLSSYDISFHLFRPSLRAPLPSPAACLPPQPLSLASPTPLSLSLPSPLCPLLPPPPSPPPLQPAMAAVSASRASTPSPPPRTLTAADLPPLPPLPESPEHVHASISTATPGSYGEPHTEDGVDFVLLNDDVLTSVANATVAMLHGHTLERLAVLYQFPQFLEHCPHESLTLMVPRICTIIVDEKPEVQMAAAEALYFVVNIKAPPHVAKCIVIATLSVIAANPESEVFDACGEILSMMLPQVARQDVLDLVVPATRDRAAARSPESRRLAARIMGSLNDSLNPSEMQTLFFSHAINLADDDDDSVRAMMAQSLGPVGVNLSVHLVEQQIWPKLRLLVADQNVRVRAAAMRALAKSAEAHSAHAESAKTYSTVLLPLFLEECKNATAVASKDLRTVSDDTYLMLEIFSEVYGYFLCSLYKLFGAKEQYWSIALAALPAMASCNGPTVRHWCAFNMPAITTVVTNRDPDIVVSILQALTTDSDIETRATLAAGIEETAKILAPSKFRNELIQAISTLFMDENAQVRMNALGHLSNLLHLLSPGQEANLARVKAAVKAERDSNPPMGKDRSTQLDSSDADSADVEVRRLQKVFTSIDAMPFDSWRTQEILAEQIRMAAHLIPQQMLCDHVAPLLFQMARESTYLVRKASMRSLMHVLRYIPDVRRRNHILKHFRTEWARGQVYWTRLAFIDGAEFALEVVSVKLFNQLFKKEILRLSHDKVPNVKTRLLSLFEKLVTRWGSSPDFTEALSHLATDADPQVSQEAQDLLSRVQSVPHLSEKETKLEKEREAQEDAFFVHRPKRRKPIANNAEALQKRISAPAAKQPSIQVVPPQESNKPKVMRQEVEEQKGSPPAVAVELEGRRPAMKPTEVGGEQPPPAKPGFFKKIFGACFGG